MAIVACGPFFSTAGLGVSLLVLLVVKPATYFAFIQAFRFRVSRDVPMSFKRAVALAVTRTLIGAALLGGVAMVGALVSRSSPVPSTYYPAILWGTLVAERLGLWLCLGMYAGLRSRRLVGWTLSGVCIDLAYDVAVGVALFDQWPIHLGILAAVAVFIYPLHRVGRRRSLVERFDATPRCARCAYDLTANVSGICPECGTAVVRPATARAA
jgi:hypothetical protein